MHLLHLLCPREQVFALAQEFEARFEGQSDLCVAYSGLVIHQPVGFVVLTSQQPFDEDFLRALDTHPDLSGYSQFPLNDDDVFGPFGSELVNSW